MVKNSYFELLHPQSYLIALAAFAAVAVQPFVPLQTWRAYPETALITYKPPTNVGIKSLAILTGNIHGFLRWLVIL